MGPLVDQSVPKKSNMAVISAFNDKNARINKDIVLNVASKVKSVLEAISMYSAPFSFRLSDSESLVNIIIGEIGTGKSTLQNNLMQRYCRKNDLKRPRNFKQMASSTQVTKAAEIRESPDSKLVAIDMPSISENEASTEGVQLTN